MKRKPVLGNTGKMSLNNIKTSSLPKACSYEM